MPDATALHIELIYTTPHEQYFIGLSLPAGSTIFTAIQASGVLQHFPALEVSTLSVGIFGKIRALQDPVTTGDRVEIYRPLIIDPKEARRARAK